MLLTLLSAFGYSYDEFIPRVKAFCNYTPFQRAALVAVAFCMSSQRVALHATVYNELNVAHNGELTLQELYMAPALMRFQLDMEKIANAYVGTPRVRTCINLLLIARSV